MILNVFTKITVVCRGLNFEERPCAADDLRSARDLQGNLQEPYATKAKLTVELVDGDESSLQVRQDEVVELLKAEGWQYYHETFTMVCALCCAKVLREAEKKP